LKEDRDDLARQNAAYEPTKDTNFMNDNQFDVEDSTRQNEISLDEEGIHLTNLALIDHKIKEPEDTGRGGECSYPRVLNMTSTQQIKQ